MSNISKRFYIIAIGFLNLIFWVITFMCRKKGIDNNVLTNIEGIELLIIGILIAYVMIFYEDLFYAIPIFCYVPFVFSHPFDIRTIPFSLYLAIIIAAIGIFIHLYRYRIKIKLGKMFIGLAMIGVSLIFGGIAVSINEYRLTQFFMMIFVSIGLLAIYVFFISGVKKVDFNIICDLINVLAAIIILQTFFSQLAYPETLNDKKLNLGWGVGNNLSLMLLFTMPFAYYQAIVNKKLIRYSYLVYVVLQYFTIIFAFSRGCMMVGALGLFIMFILGFKFFKDEILIYTSIIIVALGGVLLAGNYILMHNPELVERLNKILIKGIKFDTLNGRMKIYTDLIVKSFDYPIFGHGIYFPFTYDIDLLVENGYQWGHCTFLHALFTTGIFGTLLLTYHMVEKYYGLIKKMNIQKFTLLFSFALSGLYGLFDISYFYINYMIVLIVVLVLADGYMERLWNIKFLNKYAS